MKIGGVSVPGTEDVSVSPASGGGFNPMDPTLGMGGGGGGGGGGGWLDPNQWNPMNPGGSAPFLPVGGGGSFSGPDGSFNGPQWWRKTREDLAKAMAPGGGLDYHADTPAISQVDFAKKLQAMIDMGPESAQQNQFIRDLGAQTKTGGPQAQIAQNQLRQATNQNIGQNAGFLSSQKGINPALAARMAGQNAGMMNQQAAGQAENLKLASMLGAQQQYGDALNQVVQNDNNWMNILSQGQAAQNQAINTGKLGNQDINARIAMEKIKARSGIMGGGINAAGGIFGAMIPYLMGGGGGAAGAGGGAATDGLIAEGVSATAAHGGFIPGRAPVPGDSPANDNKTIAVSPDEIAVIIPRTKAQDPESAKSFIDELFKRQKRTSYADVLRSRRDAEQANCGGMYYDGGMARGTYTPLTPEQAAMQSYMPSQQTPPALTWKDDFKKDTDWRTGAKSVLDKQNALADLTIAKKKEDEATADIKSYEDKVAKAKKFGLTDAEINAELGQMPERSDAPTPAQQGKNPNLEYKSPVSVEDKTRMGETPAMSLEQQPGYAKTVAGIQAQAKAAEDYYKQAHQAYLDMQAKQDNALKEYQRGYKEIEDENNRLRKDIETSKVDPGRYWANMSTAGKVMSGIGVLLSGIGAGMAGQQNMAMKLIDDNISRDIDAQKAEFGKKENLLTKNMQRFGNLEDAYKATQAQLISVSQAQIADAAAKMGSTEAQGKAMQMIGQLESQKAQIQQSLALGRLKGQALPPELADRIAPEQSVGMPDGSARIATTKEGAKEIRKSQAAMASFQRTVSEMRKLSQEEGGLGTFRGSQKNAKAEALMAQARLQLKDIGELGVLSESDFSQIVDPMIPHPGSFWSSNAQTKLDELEKFAQSKVDAVMQANLQGYQPMQAKSGDIPLQ